MLLTRISCVKVPAIFQLRFNNLSHYLLTTIQQLNTIEYKDITEYFYEEFCEFIAEFYAATEKNNLTYATSIAEQFYSTWLQSAHFPDKLNTKLENAITAAISSMIMFHLAVQLAYITHYSLPMSCGLTLLSITVGIKITTPEWNSIGTLSGGLFKYRIIKSHASTSRTYRSFNCR